MYSKYFVQEDHERLEKLIKSLDAKWLLTYDNNFEIKSIYKKYEIKPFEINYSVSKQRTANEIMIYEKNLRGIDE